MACRMAAMPMTLNDLEDQLIETFINRIPRKIWYVAIGYAHTSRNACVTYIVV